MRLCFSCTSHTAVLRHRAPLDCEAVSVVCQRRCTWALQVARLVPHLSNGGFIVSELGVDPALNDVYKDMVEFVSPGRQQVRFTCVYAYTHMYIPAQGTLFAPLLSRISHCRLPPSPSLDHPVGYWSPHHPPPSSLFPISSFLIPLPPTTTSWPRRTFYVTWIGGVVAPQPLLGCKGASPPARPCAPRGGVRRFPPSRPRWVPWWTRRTPRGSRRSTLKVDPTRRRSGPAHNLRNHGRSWSQSHRPLRDAGIPIDDAYSLPPPPHVSPRTRKQQVVCD
jgi:hypothetical protein